MECILNLSNKLSIDPSLIKACQCELISTIDIKDLREARDERLKLMVEIEWDLIHDQLYIGKYDDVDDNFKRMFLHLSFLKALFEIRKNPDNFEQLTEALRVVDLGIIVGMGHGECELLTEFAEKLHNLIVDRYEPPSVEMIVTESNTENLDDVKTIDQPSPERFWTQYFHLHQPVKIENAMNDWPATKKWKDLNYFMRVAAYRTVPIELGMKYDHDDWGQGMFRFGEFLTSYFSSNEKPHKTGYLAQHDLFDQIPELRKDIIVPEYCSIGTHETIVKSWIGPQGTISTMHTDDKHNVLCQVVGEKLIILAAPEETEGLYPYDGILSNTSQIDPENLNYDEFPLAKKVNFKRLILRAGEMLFIPKGWHHYVRSLSPSISVSFWFDCDE